MKRALKVVSSKSLNAMPIGLAVAGPVGRLRPRPDAELVPETLSQLISAVLVITTRCCGGGT